MDGGHQALADFEIVMDHLDHGREAICGAACRRYDLHVRFESVVVHSHYKHGTVCRWCCYDYSACAGIQVALLGIDLKVCVLWVNLKVVLTQARSVVVKMPVASTTYSVQCFDHGILFGSFS